MPEAITEQQADNFTALFLPQEFWKWSFPNGSWFIVPKLLSVRISVLVATWATNPSFSDGWYYYPVLPLDLHYESYYVYYQSHDDPDLFKKLKVSRRQYCQSASRGRKRGSSTASPSFLSVNIGQNPVLIQIRFCVGCSPGCLISIMPIYIFILEKI